MLVAKREILIFLSFFSAEILQANDLLTQGVLLYKQVMEGRVTFGNTVASSVEDIPVSEVCAESIFHSLSGQPADPGEELTPQNILGYGVEMRAHTLFSLSLEWLYVASLCPMCHHGLTAGQQLAFVNRSVWLFWYQIQIVPLVSAYLGELCTKED